MRWRRLDPAQRPSGLSSSPAEELARLTRQLRDNERIWGAFRDLELRVVAARSLRELAGIVATELPRAFRHVDCAALMCLDPEYELSRLVEHGSLSPSAISTSGGGAAGYGRPGAFVVCSPQDLREWFPRRPWRPTLGPVEPTLQQRCFPHHRAALGSAALAPLVFQGRLIGCLAQGSADPAHFTPQAATDLLEHLAAVLALSVDNQVNQERLKLDGLTDALTGIANRRYCERRLQGEIERWRRRGEPLTCMLVDVDHFKRINDQQGHQMGDAVLKEIAALLAQELRAADVLARYGGEEFILLLPNATLPQGLAIAERVRERVARRSFGSRAAPLPVTVSVGVAALSGAPAESQGAVGEQLVQAADAALYRAKELGRNRVVAAE
jgi:diguanylate cyclase (GGDEF)-like protein